MNEKNQIRKILICLSITVSIYIIMFLTIIPSIVPKNSKIKIFDMMLNYDTHYVKTFIENIGKEQVRRYMYIQIPLDMVFAFFYSFTIFLILRNIIKKISIRINLILLLPFITGTFDYIENVVIFNILFWFPYSLKETLVSLSSFFTKAKTYSFIFNIVLLVKISLIPIKKKTDKIFKRH